jgi:hypothetical protein
LLFASPPYEDRRKNGATVLVGEAWVGWMAEVVSAALRCCRGLTCLVVQGTVEDYSWSATPALLMADLHRAGVTLRPPSIFYRVGIPGSGGPDRWRIDFEFVIEATRGGRLFWSDNTACGAPPRFRPGGDPSHRRQDGSRVNRNVGYATADERGRVGPHRARQRAGRPYRAPEIANPGCVVQETYTAREVAELLEAYEAGDVPHHTVGGGKMGGRQAYRNSAAFPEKLVERYVKSYCPPGGVVADCFSGSGTTGAVAVRLGRRFRGCDKLADQVELTRQRLAEAEAAATPAAGAGG